MAHRAMAQSTVFRSRNYEYRKKLSHHQVLFVCVCVCACAAVLCVYLHRYVCICVCVCSDVFVSVSVCRVSLCCALSVPFVLLGQRNCEPMSACIGFS